MQKKKSSYSEILLCQNIKEIYHKIIFYFAKLWNKGQKPPKQASHPPPSVPAWQESGSKQNTKQIWSYINSFGQSLRLR